MGSGASKENQRIELMLKEREAEISRLKDQLVHNNNSNNTPTKQNETIQSTHTNNTLIPPSSYMIPHHGETEEIALERYSKKQRRLEVSNEVIINRGLAKTYERQVHPKSPPAREIIDNVISNNILFRGLGKEETLDIVDAFVRVEANAGDVIISQGDTGDYFYAVESGTLDIIVSVNGSPGIKYGEVAPQTGFGELALLCNTPRAATIVVEQNDTVLWKLGRSTYREICTYHELVRRENSMKFLSNVELLRKLSTFEKERMSEALEWESYPINTTIVRQGEVGEHFYLIENGEVAVIKDGTEVSRLIKGDCFGEQSLLKDETRSATCVAMTSDVTCLSLSREHFIAMLGSLQDLLEQKEKRSRVGYTEKDETLHNWEKKYRKEEIGLEDLEILQTLGCGAFGRVRLVKHKDTGNTYALKQLVKHVIVSNNLTQHVVNERRVMEQLDHPFILKLHNTYKDSQFVYFLLEVALGGELFTHLRREGKFKETGVRFYAASVLLAFQHMHERSIIYRDLKPENLILDSEGYLKVVDFGLAKRVDDRTFTLCGTPDYLAPEIILNKGHGKAVDYWALGILIYELAAGYVPFYADDPMQVYTLVIDGNLQFPKSFSQSLRDLITKLLCQNPARRLGNLKGGIGHIMKQKWFAGFDWNGLLERKLDSARPIVPTVQHNLDASNFEIFDENTSTKVPKCSWDPQDF